MAATMKAHTVEVDRASWPPRVAFAPAFNVTVPFLDRHLAAGRDGRVLARWPGGQIAWAEAAEQAYRFASALRDLGVEPGERVMLFAKDGPAFYAGFLGAMRIGAVAIPVNYFLRAADYAYMLRDSGATVVVASEAAMGELEPALKAAGGAVAHRIAVDGPRPGWRGLDEVLAGGDPFIAPHPTTAETDAFWLYSSGSTGSPKASVHQHKDQVWTSLLFAEGIVGVTEHDVLFSPPKMFFAYGLGNSVSFPLWTGATCILQPERPTAENTLALIDQYKPTVYFAVPSLIAMQLAALESGRRVDFSSVRWCATGGEALPAPLLERWRAVTGGDAYDAIGSSEALHFYTSNTPGKIKPGSAGPIIPGYRGRVVDENGDDVPDGEVGEFAIQGASLATYYWGKPEKTEEAWRGGWFRTGDSVWRDADGYYFFSGRANDMLKVGGIWVSPFEIESALMAHPAVLEAGVVGWPDENRLVKPKAFVVLKNGRVGDAAIARELTDFIKGRLAPFKYPRWVEFLPELPKTASGKVQRFRLRPGSVPPGTV
jgi:benzoate-CoA ligase family protein